MDEKWKYSLQNSILTNQKHFGLLLRKLEDKPILESQT